MSTYGTAVVIDVADGSDTPLVRSGLDDQVGEVYLVPGVTGWTRFSAYLQGVYVLDDVTGLLERAGTARAAVAEDFDEFGASWTVLTSSGGIVTVVHRRYILNADPENPEEVAAALDDLDDDPRADDISGSGAARAAASAFDTDQAVAVAAEGESAGAWRNLNTVGGPFPWWDALGLPWPQDGIGTLLSRPTPG